MGQVPNLLHEVAKIFELISEQFILVLPNVYSRSDEHGLGLLDHLTLIFGSTVRSPQPIFLQGKNKTLWFGRANGSTIADMADLQIFYMDQYLTSFLSIRF